MQPKLKVLQVIPKLGYGGAETGCYDIAHYLPENNVDSYLITSGGELLQYIDRKKVKLIRLPVHSKNPILMFINSIIIIVIILINRINVVHARSRAPAWSCLIATKITRRKFVTTFHGTYSFSSEIKKFYNSVMVRSKLIIAGSNFIFSHINENYQKFLNVKNKLMVIFRGINLDYYNIQNISEAKKKNLIKDWKIDFNKFIILLPGRLTEWKGQEMFVEALNILREDYNKNNFQAIILGSNQGRKVYSKKLHSLVERYRMGNDIKFIDYCKDMPTGYSIADVVVSSSIRPEAFGRVSVEAQAMKKLIIASNIGGSRETIVDKKSGLLYKAGDPRELARTINDAMELDKEILHSMGNEGRKNVSKKFDVEKMCHTTFTEYQKLLK